MALPGRWERVGEPSESMAVSENPRREHVAWRRGGVEEDKVGEEEQLLPVLKAVKPT